MKPQLPEPISLRRLYSGPLLLAVAIALLPLGTRGEHAYLLPLAQLCGIYAIIVTGLTLLMGFTGQVSLGHAGFYGFGAYVAAVATESFHVPAGLAVVLALLGGALLSLVSGFMVLRLKGNHLALATLCLGIILAEFINRSKLTHGAEGILDLPEITFPGMGKSTAAGRFYLIWIFAWLVMLWGTHLAASPVGRALRAIHGDEEAAAALGVPVFVVKLKVFVASGVLAALAGVLYAFVYTPSYLGPEEFSLMLSVMLVTMGVVGGMGSIWGGLVGAVTMTSLHEAIVTASGKLGITDVSRYEQLVYGLLLVLTLIFFPRGLVPGMHHWWQRRFRKRRIRS